MQDELRFEEKKLDALKKNITMVNLSAKAVIVNYAMYQMRIDKMKEELDRSQKNVDALKREVFNLK